MLGSDLLPELEAGGHEVIAPRRVEFNVSDPEAAAAVATGGFGSLDAVINLAAYTAVDAAEGDLDRAYGSNALGPGLLSRACAMANLRLVHLSTDYVFDGRKGEPYVETDATNPLGIYGKSKRDGEEAIRASGAKAIILRTSWLFGAGGKSFPGTILAAAKAGKLLRVVDDQLGTPTYTVDLAKVIRQVLESEIEAGIYHAAGPKVTTWFMLASLVLTVAGIEAEVEGISTAEWPTAAPRPRYSALDCTKLAEMGITIDRSLRDSVTEFVQKVAPTLG